jgi:hypothetical protein
MYKPMYVTHPIVKTTFALNLSIHAHFRKIADTLLIRVARRVCEKIAQNVGYTIFVEINA